MQKRTIVRVRNMVIERSIVMGVESLIKKLFSGKECSPIEREVRRRLTWRIIWLSLSPLPFLFLLIISLYYFIRLNAGSIAVLFDQNCKITAKLLAIENELHSLTGMTNNCERLFESGHPK